MASAASIRLQSAAAVVTSISSDFRDFAVSYDGDPAIAVCTTRWRVLNAASKSELMLYVGRGFRFFTSIIGRASDLLTIRRCKVCVLSTSGKHCNEMTNRAFITAEEVLVRKHT